MPGRLLILILVLLAVIISISSTEITTNLPAATNEVAWTAPGDSSRVTKKDQALRYGQLPFKVVFRPNSSSDDIFWSSVGGGTDAFVVALAEFNGDLIAGGAFWHAGTELAQRVAAWDGSNWSPLGQGTNTVFALATFRGDLIAGGSRHLSSWNGFTWTQIGSNVNGNVWSLCVWGEKLIVAGEFTTIGGISAANIASWDGASWSALGNGTNGRVNALCVYDGALIAGGDFSVAGVQSVNGVASWNGAEWSQLGGGTGVGVSALITFRGDLIAGGASEIGGVERWNGQSWSVLGSGTDRRVWALTAFDDKLIAGGQFMVAGTDSTNLIASWNGHSWNSLGSGIVGGAVMSLTTFDNSLIVGGLFQEAGNQAAYNIAKWSKICRAKPPIVLVHGWNSDPSVWDTLRSWLWRDGFCDVWTPSLYSCGAPGEHQFDLNSQILSDSIESLRDSFESEHGYRPNRINIVAHSMGGMIARRYAVSDDSWSANSNGLIVENLIMLGTPNQGVPFATILSTRIALLCLMPSSYCDFLTLISDQICNGPASSEFALDKVALFNRNERLNAHRQATQFIGIAGEQLGSWPAYIGLLLGYPNDLFVSTWSVLDAKIRLPGGLEPVLLDGRFVMADPDPSPHPTLHNKLPSHRGIYDAWIKPSLLETQSNSYKPLYLSNEDENLGRGYHSSQIGIIKPNSTKSETLSVAPGECFTVMAASFNLDLSYTLQSPLGQIVDANCTGLPANDCYQQNEGIIVYHLAEPAPGEWIISITADELEDTIAAYFFVTDVCGPIEMDASISSEAVDEGDTIFLFVDIRNSGLPVTDATVKSLVPAGDTELLLTIQHLDNGAWPDQIANDGIYSAAWIPQNLVGAFNVLIKAEGTTVPFQRETVLTVLISRPDQQICGDFNSSGSVDIADAVRLINYIFAGGPAPLPNISACDIDCSGQCDIADAVYLISYIFGSGSAPCSACR